MGTGAFHAAVEVYGAEYSFGGCARGTGVFACRPRSCSAHHYREAMDMGPTPKSAAETAAILAELSQRWQGAEYDLLRHNCCHFSRELLQRLEVKDRCLPSTHAFGGESGWMRPLRRRRVRDGFSCSWS